ncbi:uncharacterized protein LOC122538683, partial [Frieseomelitta varia]|uniref:uncharacterized protein LOC122538683 n=1 Tax=Frieseomelitta varia TaxID=561572 RepID=UPI001CB69722
MQFNENAAEPATIETIFDFSFWDIPSAWWQASTVAMGIGVAIAVIGALTLLAAASSFLPHILKTPKHTRALGSLQLLAVRKFTSQAGVPSTVNSARVRDKDLPKVSAEREVALRVTIGKPVCQLKLYIK